MSILTYNLKRKSIFLGIKRNSYREWSILSDPMFFYNKKLSSKKKDKNKHDNKYNYSLKKLLWMIYFD